MARPGVTREQVIEAAQHIVESGNIPTVQTVRDALGAGSFTTITQHLREWRAQEASGAAAPASLPEEVEAAAVRAAGAIWQAAEQLARREIDAARVVAAGRVDEFRAQAQEALQEVARLEADSDALRARLADQAAVLVEVRAALAHSQAAMSAEQAKSAGLAGRVDELKVELSGVREISEQRIAAIGKFEGELAALKAELAKLQPRHADSGKNR